MPFEPATGVQVAGLSDLTERSAVLQAIAEFDELGRDAFLAHYGYGPARSYFVVHDGKWYDSKAIAGVAAGKQIPASGPLAASDFSGGEATVKAKLESLAFKVISTNDEIEGAPGPGEAQAWAEVTSLEHGHGGEGWGLGQYLWSPTTAKNGSDRYAVMNEPAAGDQVFHLVSGLTGEPAKRRFLYGVSRVREPALVTSDRPPLPGSWSQATSYFRIELSEFREFNPNLPMDEIEDGLADLILSELLERPKYYPYAPYRGGFRGSQGIYLTRLSGGLTKAFRELVDLEWQANRAPSGHEELSRRAHAAALEFAEGERSRRESSFFRRNPRLREEAIKRFGVRCIACRFDFEEQYGSAGKGYIEIHHLNPLAERRDAAAGAPIMTTLEDVVPVCANCHRVIHRRRPAMSIADVKTILEQTKSNAR
jgi:hypothetical protein